MRNVGAPASVIVESPWGDDDDKTTVSLMDFTDRSGVIDIDSDTQLDDRSIDEILTGLAVGTNETRSPGQQAFMTSPDSSPPITSAVPPPPITSAVPPPPIAPVSHPSVPYPYSTAPITYGTAPFPYPVVAPPPYPAPRAQARSPLQVVASVLLLGLILLAAAAVGKYLFAGGAAAPPAASQATPSAPAPSAAPPAAPVAMAPAMTAPATTAPALTPTPAAPAPAAAAAPAERPIRLAIASLREASESLASSPVQGEVTRAYLTEAREVAEGEKLFEITHRVRGAAHARQLAAEVKKLERLAADEPEYQPFLEKARRDYQQASSRSETTVVRSPRAGLAAPQVARGAQVKAGDRLATTGDAGSWIAHAIVGAERPGVDWACSVVPADADDARATCVIEQLVDSRDGAEVIARVKADDAAWLRSPDPKQLVLQPPAAAPR